MEQTTICIIDDHAIVRQGLKGLLEKIGDYKVIKEFDDGDDFLAALPLSPAPDIYILDYSMPHKNGVEVLQALEQKQEQLKVLLLTQHFDEQIINLAYHHGARGFLHKNCSAHDLKFAIDSINKVGYYNVAEILKRVRNIDTATLEIKHIDLTMSERELQFLKLVCNESELTYEQMAEEMGLSVKTIDGYRTAL
ncbi:MAG TPA: response regulator transcription factor, partial [Flavobacterium sp.]|nr:response regulator transcription factor [Flavobacterium sp.]